MGYSALLSRHLARVPLLLRLGTCFLTIDGPLAVLMQAQARGPLVQRVALLNDANLMTAAAWCGSSVLGIALAALVTLRARSFVLLPPRRLVRGRSTDPTVRFGAANTGLRMSVYGRL